MSLSSAARTITQKEREFVTLQVEKFQQQPQKINWIRKKKIKNGKFKRIEDRIFVVTKFWVFTIGKRRNSIHKKICRFAHLFDLKGITRKASDNMILKFKDFEIDLHTAESDEFLKIILTNFYRLVHGFPENELPKIEAENTDLPTLKDSKPGKAGNFVRTYKAWCSYSQIPANDFLIENIKSRFQDTKDFYEGRTLDLSVIDKLPQLKQLTFSDLNASEGFTNLGNMLVKESIALTHLDLSGNRISDKDIIQLSKGILELKSGLKYLDLSRTKLTVNSTCKIIEVLKENLRHHSIEHLNLSKCKLSQNGTNLLGDFFETIKSTTQLNRIELAFCNLNLEKIVDLIIKYYSRTTLNYLNLSGNHIKKKHLLFSKLCKSAVTLETLEINNCKIKINDSSEIFKNILQNENLSDFSLNLCNNPIKMIGIKAMTNILENNKQFEILQKLYLDDCSLGDSGLILLCEAISKHSTLEVLSISRNFSKNTTSTCREKISTLFSHPTLKYLRIRGTLNKNLGLTDKNSVDFFEPLKTNEKIIGLDLSYNYMGGACFTNLMNNLSNKNSIRSLYFNQNNLTVDAITQFYKSFEQKHKICDIKWPGSDIYQLNKVAKKNERDVILTGIEQVQGLIAIELFENRKKYNIHQIQIIEDEVELDIIRKGLNQTAFTKNSNKKNHKNKNSCNENSQNEEALSSEELIDERYMDDEEENGNENQDSSLQSLRTRRLTTSIQYNGMMVPPRVKNMQNEKYEESNFEENVSQQSEENFY
ncbi:leucine-rich repeat [Anaeramoeba flamelloides]|uniref:Leucine-rich repeat n=1 Tax=Anaeramoeba flamelloides TaxID=1746091 RepID=A0ABQ8XXV5_9EUKA|nr:leucine-rich repeat [Anaeramoeba flamelloides]